jgi:hypothetical protein
VFGILVTERFADPIVSLPPDAFRRREPVHLRSAITGKIGSPATIRQPHHVVPAGRAGVDVFFVDVVHRQRAVANGGVQKRLDAFREETVKRFPVAGLGLIEPHAQITSPIRNSASAMRDGVKKQIGVLRRADVARIRGRRPLLLERLQEIGAARRREPLCVGVAILLVHADRVISPIDDCSVGHQFFHSGNV